MERRYQSLDHWRGLACLLVIVYHSTIVYWSLREGSGTPAIRAGIIEWLITQTHEFSVGVALFFVISGYCIAAAADGARRKGISSREYFIRRFRRIYPPLWAVVVVSLVFFAAVDYVVFPGLLSHEPWSQPRPSWYSPSQWLGNITLTETWRHHLFGAPRGHFPGQAWTLCYEEQFYLITGLLLALCPTSFFFGIFAVSGLTVGAVFGARALSIPIDGSFLDGSWLLFAAGVAVYYRLHHGFGWRSHLVDGLLLLLIPAAWLLNIPIQGAVLGFAFAIVLPRLRQYDSQIVSSKVAKPFFYCGQMCYSLYLVHQLPVRAISGGLHSLGLTSAWSTLFVTVPVCVLASVSLGRMFFVTVERRFMNAPYQSQAHLAETENHRISETSGVTAATA